MTAVLLLILFFVIVVGCFFFVHHQNNLKLRARLMREAVRNHDFTFHLPVKGLFYGEKALQEALNDLGNDINGLCAQKEVESWQKLTRVLTHEIMNVTTPIQSISQAYLESSAVQGTSLEKGIQAINKASNHLITFVDSYRKLTQLQEPVKVELNLRTVINHIIDMYPHLQTTLHLPACLIIKADKSLIGQVLLNIVKNAIEAGAHTMSFDWHNRLLHISNDGAPIPAEIRRDIFIPFYSTKPTGSGIGLALSRQIITMQGGTLSLVDKAKSGYHTTFLLNFGDENVVLHQPHSK